MWIVLYAALFVLIVSSVGLAEIEVYSAGKHFSSFEIYQNSIKQKINEFDLSDNTNVKHVLIQRLSTIDSNKINLISFNKGVEDSLISFKNWKNVRFVDMIDRSQLEITLRDTIGKNHQPALIISESGKLRILSFDADSATQMNSKVNLQNN